jgi:hypothetical protein
MRQSIRALGWTVTISTLVLLVFLFTVFYSAVSLIISQAAILGEFQTNITEDGVVLSMPIALNNTGYYDMDNFRLTTTMRTAEGTVLVEKSTVIPEIHRGCSESRRHNLTLSFSSLLANNTDLLFNDTDLRMDFLIGFRYAYAVGFQICIANMSMPWGAPFHNLELSDVSISGFNGTHATFQVSLQFENHFFLDAGGILHIEVFNDNDEHVGDGMGAFLVPSGGRLTEPIQALVEITDPEGFTGTGYIKAYIEIPMFMEPLEIGRINYG